MPKQRCPEPQSADNRNNLGVRKPETYSDILWPEQHTPRRGLREGNGGHVLEAQPGPLFCSTSRAFALSRSPRLATEPGAEISQPDTRNTLALALSMRAHCRCKEQIPNKNLHQTWPVASQGVLCTSGKPGLRRQGSHRKVPRPTPRNAGQFAPRPVNLHAFEGCWNWNAAQEAMGQLSNPSVKLLLQGLLSCFSANRTALALPQLGTSHKAMSEPADWPNAAMARCRPWLSKGIAAQQVMASLIWRWLRKLLLYVHALHGVRLWTRLGAVAARPYTKRLSKHLDSGTAKIPLIDGEPSRAWHCLSTHDLCSIQCIAAESELHVS